MGNSSANRAKPGRKVTKAAAPGAATNGAKVAKPAAKTRGAGTKTGAKTGRGSAKGYPGQPSGFSGRDVPNRTSKGGVGNSVGLVPAAGTRKPAAARKTARPRAVGSPGVKAAKPAGTKIAKSVVPGRRNTPTGKGSKPVQTPGKASFPASASAAGRARAAGSNGGFGGRPAPSGQFGVGAPAASSRGARGAGTGGPAGFSGRQAPSVGRTGQAINPARVAQPRALGASTTGKSVTRLAGAGRKIKGSKTSSRRRTAGGGGAY
jgi:hypothetical protein